jgi:hypothetical protein
MNREGAETYLRLLGEARMRGWVMAAPRPAWAAGPASGRARMMAVGQALAAVGALDTGTVEEILADFNLAVSVRQVHDQASPEPPGVQGPGGAGQGPGQGAAASRRSAAGAWPAVAMARWTPQSGPIGSGPLAKAVRLPPAPPPRFAGSGEPEDADPSDRGESDRFVPVGLTIPFRDEGVLHELYLLSFAQTGAGARFIALWGLRTPSLQHMLGLARPDLLPPGRLTVTDDRGARYDLDFAPGSGPGLASELSLRPAPPGDIRWLEISPPPGPAARIDLSAANGAAADPGPRVSEAELSPGEFLLTMLAERLLTLAPEFAGGLRRPLGAVSPGPLQAMASALGDIIGALEAADVLSPLSPVPGRLAALCASLGVDEHGIAVPPAHDLPEPWLSLLAHYQRRKPDTAPVRDGFAAMAAALPDLDGIRLALLGLHNTEGHSSLYALARGMTAEGRPGPLGVDLDFPLSIWLRDPGGRWHTTCPAAWHRPGPPHRECTMRLRLVPPLPRSTPWVEVLAGGQSAEVSARLPLRWRYPS